MILVIGFDAVKKGAPTCLYCGDSGEEAAAIFATPPAGTHRVELFRNPGPTRRRFIAPAATEEAAAPAPSVAEPTPAPAAVEEVAEAPAEAAAPEEVGEPAEAPGLLADLSASKPRGKR